MRQKGSPMSKERAAETRRRVRAWIIESIRQGFGKPTQQDIRNRFGLSHGAASGILADYNAEQAQREGER